MSQQKEQQGSSSEPEESLAKQIEREGIELLEKRGLTMPEPIMAKRPLGARKGDLQLSTNLYPAILPQGSITLYRYDVRITGTKASNPDRVMEFTKKFRDDFTQVERRYRSRDVIVSFMNVYRDIAQMAGCMYHDLQAIMYTLKPMEGGVYAFDIEQLHNSVEFSQYRLGKVRLELTPTKNNCILLEDVPQQSNLVYVNRDLAQFLDIATSQQTFFREHEHVHFSTANTYLLDPSQFGFTENDTLTFEENCTYLGIGCQKAIHTVEGGDGQTRAGGLPVVVIQPKKTPFHSEVSLLVKVDAMLGAARIQSNLIERVVPELERYLKGLMVYTVHNPDNVQYFPIKGIARFTADQHTIQIGDVTTTVAKYFRSKYNVQLSRSELPLVYTDGRKGEDGKKQQNFYPIEVLVVCDNQRVKTQQMTSNMTSQAIRRCAVPPYTLREQVLKTARSLHLFDQGAGNAHLSAANIQILEKPLQVHAHQLKTPNVQAGDQGLAQHRDGTWRVSRMLHPQQMVGPGRDFRWAAIAFSYGDRGSLNLQELENFLRFYNNQARTRNMNMGEPAKTKVFYIGNVSDMKQHFQLAQQENLAFLLCFHGDNDDQAHHEIKALERMFMVVTQCVKTGTARNVLAKSQRLTVDNILNKTNVKLGGMNFMLPASRIAIDPTTLVIGIASNHPAGGFGEGDEAVAVKSNPNQPPSSLILGAPTVVGFAANVGPTRSPFDFVGDFLYQNARREEKVNLIEDIVNRCIHYFEHTRNGAKPERVIIYRNGCSEGQFSSLLRFEVPLIRAAIQALGCTPKVTVIVPNKLQNVRFFKQQIQASDRAPFQNLPPGVAIDTGAVHPTFVEFFLNSHKALQGTARTPKYTLIYDDSDFNLVDLETMTYELCYGHQIVFSPLSLPAPVYIALEYAKRGRNLYNQLSDTLRRQNPNMGMTALNQALSFYAQTGGECWLSEYRVNA